ncbi:MAG: phosphoglucosamine mutase [Coriobacteriia bacterium]|jgi:phosphoglucosamine mutase|nr:phosphoglucosamine mutase [Coriobacteriia bacterium]
MTRLFGTDGVRGIANEDLTPELAFRLGEAAGHFLGDKGTGRIVVGRDTRRSGEMLEAAMVAGICSGGADALVAGVVPTPAVAYLTRELGADGGVVISASHNPASYNGIKFFSRDGFKLPDELEDEIEEFIASERDWERPTGAGVGRAFHLADAVDRYVDHAVSSIDTDLKGMTIAVDCGHGAASVATPRALEELGARVISVNCDWNGMDINDGCGSTNLAPLVELVKGGGVDFGIAHDGDADRVLAVDDAGDEVDGDMIMAICAVQMKERDALPADTVVSTVMCNLGFEVAMRERGINVIKTKVGDRYVLEQMRASGAALGGEQSGHVIFMEHNTTGDGLITALQLAAAVRHAGRPMSQLRTVMTRYPQVLVNVPVKDRGRLSTSPAVLAAISAAEEELGETGRVLVRASGTEPLVRVMAEAAEEEAAAAVVERLAKVVKAELGG